MLQIAYVIQFLDSSCGWAANPEKLCCGIVGHDPAQLFDPIPSKRGQGTVWFVKLGSGIDVVELFVLGWAHVKSQHKNLAMPVLCCHGCGNGSATVTKICFGHSVGP